MDFDIAVVASNRRKALIIDYLQNIQYKINFTPDYSLPENFQPKVIGLVQPSCHIGAYRCLRGHQDAISLFDGTKNMLIFEDDAVPNINSWIDICRVANQLTKQFEYVSIHSRQFDENQYEKKNIENIEYLVPKTNAAWAVATLAYIITPEAGKKIKTWEYNGCPLDVLIYKQMNYCIVNPSPFNHNMSQGSLIDVR